MQTPADRPSTPAAEGRRALGRGLSALLPTVAAPERRGPTMISLEEIKPERGQPRRHFERAALEELAQSIQVHGVLQPVLVRRDGDGYRLICGERRWRAAQLAMLREIPALIREATETEAFEMALVENLQRADLSPIEEAEGYRRLIEEHNLTQEEAAVRVGKDRTTVTNALRLLRLPDEVKELLTTGELSMGHARALLGIADEPTLRHAALEVARTRMSVREVERLVRKLRGGERPAREPAAPSAAVQALVESLQRALGTKVRLRSEEGQGTIEIDFVSHEHLDTIVARLLRPA